MVWIVTLDVPSFVKSTLNWTFILLMIKKLSLKNCNVGFNFSSHFLQVSQIDLNTMQQYLTHSKKKLPLWLPKKSTMMCFYPSGMQYSSSGFEFSPSSSSKLIWKAAKCFKLLFFAIPCTCIATIQQLHLWGSKEVL